MFNLNRELVLVADDEPVDRRALASRDIGVGTEVLRDEVVTALKPEHRASRCSECLCGPILQRGGCCDANFCSDECAARHVCFGEDLVGCSETVLATAKLLATGVDVSHLKGHDNDRAQAIAKGLAATFSGVDETIARQLVCILATNAHGIVDSSETEDIHLGLALSVPGSVFNHACDPTTAVSFDLHQGTPPALVVRAIKPIARGSELTLSYLPCDGSTSSERQRYLQDAYHFTCTCDCCRPGVLQAALDTKLTNGKDLIVRSSSSSPPDDILPLARDLWTLVHDDLRLRSLAIPSVHFARILTIAAGITDRPEERTAWSTLAGDILRTTLGPDALLTRKALFLS